MSQAIELGAPELRRVCDPTSLGFKTTAELPVLSEVLGQPRAVAALAFGASITARASTCLPWGQPATLIREYLEHRAETEPVPPDLCYVYNFGHARLRLPLLLPPGRGLQLKQDVDTFYR